MIKIQFKTEDERKQIINDNNDKYLVETWYLVDGNFLIFSLDEPLPSLEEQINDITKEQANKISILEAENAQIQYAMMMGGLL